MKMLLLLALIILEVTSCFAQTRSKLVHNDSIFVKIDSILKSVIKQVQVGTEVYFLANVRGMMKM